MKFRFEDFLKNIIPGMVILAGVLIIFIGYPFPVTKAALEQSIPPDAKEFSDIYLLLFLVGSYLLGYFNDAVSSWGEYYLLYGIFGNPSFRLLSGQGKRIHLVQTEAILKHLLKLQTPGITDTNLTTKYATCLNEKEKFNNAKQFFKLANEVKDGNTTEAIINKVTDFYYAYIFSRNLFFSSLICFILVTIACWHNLNWWLEGFFLALIVVLNLRRRDKSYYYSRSVLLACKF